MSYNYLYIYIIFEYLYFVMKKQYIYSCFYLLGILINILFNYLLKYIFLIPKPYIDINIFHLKIIQNNYKLEELGMPSLYFTLLFYSFTYFYLIYYTSWINYIFILFLIYVIFIFFAVKQASILQILFGSIIGICFAFLFIFYSKYFLKGKVKENKKHELILV